MSEENRNLSLAAAADLFLLTLPGGEKGSSRQELRKFVRWFGVEHPIAGLTGSEVTHYAERLSLSDAGYAKKLDLIRNFLTYARKEGWNKTNLAMHLKAKKDKSRRESAPHNTAGQPDAVLLTKQGYADLEAELDTLRNKRPALIEEIQRAAADKDFKENVPLHAAREARGHLEGRILELEAMLNSAAIIEDQKKSNLRVNVGDSVVLCNVDSGEERRYTLVSPREVDPVRGKISSVSPIGQAVVNRKQGEVVEVVAPAGKSRYEIKQVER